MSDKTMCLYYVYYNQKPPAGYRRTNHPCVYIGPAPVCEQLSFDVARELGVSANWMMRAFPEFRAACERKRRLTDAEHHNVCDNKFPTRGENE